MICIGKLTDLETELDALITKIFPQKLVSPELITKALAYEKELKIQGHR